MFFWNKRKDTAKEAVQEEIDIDALLAEAELLKDMLEDKGGEEKTRCLNKLGELYFKAAYINEAIDYYEQSLARSNALGKAYTDLLKLYNIKRREAADAKNDEETKMYLEKINELMKRSKDIIRGKA